MIEHLKAAIKILKLEDINTLQVTKIGEGAWHSVYKIQRIMEEDVVIRVKKKKAYGQLQEFDELELKSEYQSSKAYYELANQCSADICPSFFTYFIDESMVFTIESYMGEGIKLQRLNSLQAYNLGKKLGQFFRAMHAKNSGIKGFGNLVWNGKQLEGSLHHDAAQIWQSDNNHYVSVIDKLSGTDLEFNRNIVAERIVTIIKKRRVTQQTISLVNQDITPENILFKSDKVFLIDPFPRLDFSLKYAGYFVFCYKFLFKVYSNAPRYQKNQYNEIHAVLTKVADGYIYGYIGERKYLYKQIINEYILWTLLETYEHYEMLKVDNLSGKTMEQMGNKDMINQRLKVCLKHLEELCKT